MVAVVKISRWLVLCHLFSMHCAIVEVYGRDESGMRSRRGALSFTLPEKAAKQITAQDIENGNPDKGLISNLCDS